METTTTTTTTSSSSSSSSAAANSRFSIDGFCAMLKRTGLIIFTFFIFSCKQEKVKYAYYYIPYDYSGWVNIIFNDSTTSNEYIENENGTLIYFITGNPSEYKVSQQLAPSGKYSERFFLYNKDTLLEVYDLASRDPRIFNKGTSGFSQSNGNLTKARDAIKSVNFYVRPDSLTYDELKEKRVPKNELFPNFN